MAFRYILQRSSSIFGRVHQPWFLIKSKNCFSVTGFDKYNDINLEILMRAFSSHKTGDSRLNEFFSGAAQQFRSAATALMLGSTITLSGVAANAQEATRAQTVSAETTDQAVPSVPMSERLETTEKGARLIAASASKDGILFLTYGESQWLIDELSFAIYDGHQKGRAVKGIALGPSASPVGFDVYVNGIRIAEARDVANTDVRGGATYAIEYGQNILDTLFAKEASGSAPSADTVSTVSPAR